MEFETVYIYQNHMGGYYTSTEELDDDFLYCEDCGDCDLYLGQASNVKEVWDVISPELSVLDSTGGWCSLSEACEDLIFCFVDRENFPLYKEYYKNKTKTNELLVLEEIHQELDIPMVYGVNEKGRLLMKWDEDVNESFKSVGREEALEICRKRDKEYEDWEGDMTDDDDE